MSGPTTIILEGDAIRVFDSALDDTYISSSSSLLEIIGSNGENTVVSSDVSLDEATLGQWKTVISDGALIITNGNGLVSMPNNEQFVFQFAGSDDKYQLSELVSVANQLDTLRNFTGKDAYIITGNSALNGFSASGNPFFLMEATVRNVDGDDRFLASSRDDVIEVSQPGLVYGLTGNDELYAYQMHTGILIGGSGDDVYHLSRNGRVDVADAGGGYDTIVFSDVGSEESTTDGVVIVIDSRHLILSDAEQENYTSIFDYKTPESAIELITFSDHVSVTVDEVIAIAKANSNYYEISSSEISASERDEAFKLLDHYLISNSEYESEDLSLDVPDDELGDLVKNLSVVGEGDVSSGTVMDGYVSGASIYLDSNGNNSPDNNENIGVLTDEFGRFSYDGALTGSVIAVGGVNTDTRLPNNLILTAPEGASVISPLTTLLDSLIDGQGYSQASAQEVIKNSFGLPPGIDLTEYDPLADSSDDSISVQKLNVKLAILANSSDAEQLWINVAEELSEQSGSVDLSDLETLNRVVRDSEVPLDQLANANSQIDAQSTLDEIAASQRTETITEGHKVAGLYAAFFNRAPDASGLSYWEDYVYVQGLSLDDLAAAFTTHPIFTETYGSLSNQDFVEAIYQNMLGGAGDQGGIDYWVGELDGGLARSKMVSDFVQGSLVIDLDAMLSDGVLTQQEYDDAVGRQNFITNKAMVGVEFAQRMGELSNVTSEGLDLLEDPAYLASIAILENVSNTPESYDVIIELINDATEADGSPLDFIIDEVEQVASQSVTSNWLSYDLI